MPLGLWPFLPSLGCMMQILLIEADIHTQGCLQAKMPSGQTITVSACVLIYVYVFLFLMYLYIYKNM